jgi:crotonobetainyl-CoA:carnitine CoA-transferase CaiB-like acyl-CoA transferase
MKLTVRDPAGNPVELVGNPVKLAGAAEAAARMPPRLGEQTAEVLRELAGIDAERFAALQSRSVV